MNKIYEKFNDICYERDSRLVKLEYLIKSNRRKVIYGAGRAALLRYNWFQAVSYTHLTLPTKA